jgi:uncharacterized protein YlxW (UPF0749 family)
MTERPHRRLRGPRAPVVPEEGSGDPGLDLAAPAGTPARPRRSPLWRVGTPLVGVLSGALFVVSAHSSEGTDLRPGRFTDLASMVQYDASRADALKQRVSDLQQQVTDLSSSVGNKQVQQVNRRADGMKGAAGLEAVSGPGVTVTLSDAPHTSANAHQENPLLLIVHQQDIQAVVNAMWKAGARAVTIQGQRVVSTTGIRCIGNAVQLQGVPYSQPYVISAVGDPTTISDAIARDSYLQVYREDAVDPAVGVGWQEQTEEHLVAPAYDGLLGLSYASVLPTNGSSG